MPEHPGLDLKRIHGRSIVRLRVRPNAAEAAGRALRLPLQAMQWCDEDPASHWLGPDQWLLTSDTKSAKDIIANVDGTLSGQLHAATDMSSQNACFALRGPASRTVLAMGCGIDMHKNELIAGQCVRTNFANVPLFIVVVEDNSFDLYLDRSYAVYLRDWLRQSGEDPITRDAKILKVTVS